jgi:EAL domain-containing protein (putative c-di-GMP-specific phosphodiesterase class I)
LWLDDFGSGYSGLNVLKEYEFDVMKIDMKFLQHFGENEKAKIILKNIVSLAKDIGMGTLTEGVETEEAFNFLKEIGCERLQGYLFGKPMPRETLLEKINQGTYVMAKTNA